MKIGQDNQAVIHSIQRGVPAERSRHVDIRYFWLKDMLTKPLKWKFSGGCGIYSSIGLTKMAYPNWGCVGIITIWSTSERRLWLDVKSGQKPLEAIPNDFFDKLCTVLEIKMELKNIS